MPQYDASRLADIRKLEGKLADPNVSEHEKKRAQEALYAIKNQAQYSSIRKMREKMTAAMINGDRAAAERISEEAKRIDRDYQ